MVRPSRRMLLSCPTLWLSCLDPPADTLMFGCLWYKWPFVFLVNARDAIGSQIACEVTKGITVLAGKVELDCCKLNAKRGVCPTNAAMDRSRTGGPAHCTSLTNQRTSREHLGCGEIDNYSAQQASRWSKITRRWGRGSCNPY